MVRGGRGGTDRPATWEPRIILKSFAKLESTPGVPGLDLPGLDIASIAHGCAAQDAATPGDVRDAFRAALGRKGPSVIVVPISRAVSPLL